jgi:outer membrane protein OmpA-like peptidoglycan-associated protein
VATAYTKRPCWLPLFLGLMALGILGIWGIYFGPHAAPLLRETTRQMGQDGLKSTGIAFADVQIENATAIISGTAPDEAAKAAAFAAASAAMMKTQGIPGVVATFENRIQVAAKPQPVAVAPIAVTPPKPVIQPAPKPAAALPAADIILPAPPSVVLSVDPPAVPAIVIAAPKAPVAQPALPMPAPDTCEKNFMRALEGRSINFVTSRAEIMKSSQPLLNQLAVLAKNCSAHVISIEGHTDTRGWDELNQALSEERAKAVLAYLNSKGVPNKSLVAIGYGEKRPLDRSGTLEAFARNRRIEFKVKPR